LGKSLTDYSQGFLFFSIFVEIPSPGRLVPNPALPGSRTVSYLYPSSGPVWSPPFPPLPTPSSGGKRCLFSANFASMSAFLGAIGRLHLHQARVLASFGNAPARRCSSSPLFLSCCAPLSPSCRRRRSLGEERPHGNSSCRYRYSSASAQVPVFAGSGVFGGRILFLLFSFL